MLELQELTIYSAEKCQQQLIQLLKETEQGETLELDLAKVSEIDSAGLQLLLSLAVSAQAAGKELQFYQVSEQVRALIEFYHIQQLGALIQS